MISLVEMQTIPTTQILLALLSFVCVVLGGSAIGLASGLFASYVTTWTKEIFRYVNF